jgi:uncharacterized protein (DUF885 family)
VRRALLLLVLVACKSTPAHVEPPKLASQTFAQRVDVFLDEHFAFRPTFAVALGLHEYDGKVPDRSKAAIAAEIARLHRAEQTFAEVDARSTPREQVEREVILAEIRKELFELETLGRPWRDPTFYLFRFSLSSYIARDYAPAADRAAAMLRACEAAPAYYRQANENLEDKLPRAYLQAAMFVGNGLVTFLKTDAANAFDDPKLKACLATLSDQVATFLLALQHRVPQATDDFRLGGDKLVAMLKAGEGIDLDVATLEKMAKDDLAANRAAIIDAAKQIDPARDVAAVIAEVSADKPAPDAVIAEATAQLAELKKFLVDNQIVSLPREDTVEVREPPAFQRGNFAALWGVGPFETKPLPSYYYIAPPDPTWPAEQQRAYVMSRSDLLFTSAHEVYPGHFVQGMHERASTSRILQTFEAYTTSEGWAHYVEQMMWEQGLGHRDPRAHIGQLKNALLRDVRFLVTLGYHAGTLTPEAATKLFVEQAFADLGNAKQQALRGTVDPMYLSYTLGKLLILQIRADWQRAHPQGTLRAFHDEFLSYGEAPLPVIRRMMLGR